MGDLVAGLMEGLEIGATELLRGAVPLALALGIILTVRS